jgi:DNA-binding beta-propeller fold protein YncE
MRISGVSRCAFGICTAAALLAGCGGSQPLIGAPGTMPQSSGIATHADRSGSWMLSEAKNGAELEYKATTPLLYVANTTFDGNDVTVYDASAMDPAPIVTITVGINTPNGDCVDEHGTLYVANAPISGGGSISEYLRGMATPFKVVTDGINSPAFCAIDGKGNLWVTNLGIPSVTEYLAGSKRVYEKITKGLVFPDGIAFDHAGNMYVANRLGSYSGNVVVYASGSKAPKRTITNGVTAPVGIAVDASGTLYVTDNLDNDVEEYFLGHDRPSRTITKGLNSPGGAAVNKRGWLYVSNFGDDTVAEFPPGSITPSKRKISQGLYTPLGMAHYPPLLP